MRGTPASISIIRVFAFHREHDCMDKGGIDVVYMPWTAKEERFGFIVFAVDDLSE